MVYCAYVSRTALSCTVGACELCLPEHRSTVVCGNAKCPIPSRLHIGLVTTGVVGIYFLSPL